MTDERGRPDAGDVSGGTTGDAPISGVARGALGTGTALEDTQVWDMSALQEPAAAAEQGSEPASTPPPAATPGVTPAAAAAAAAAAAEPQVEPAVAAAAPLPDPVIADAATAPMRATPVRATPVRRARPEPATHRSPALTALVAALGLAFLVGVGIVATQGNLAVPDLGGVPPAAASTPTAQPDTADDEGNGDNGKGKDKCHGRGNDKCDRGDGNGDD